MWVYPIYIDFLKFNIIKFKKIKKQSNVQYKQYH